MELGVLAPHPLALLTAVAVDGLLGDPVYAWHPVRLMGRSLSAIESRLRAIGLDGYWGGILLFLLLSILWISVLAGLVLAVASWNAALAWVLHTLLAYSLLALRDLLVHANRVQQAANAADLFATRHAISQLVGRDTTKMDIPACRRAAIESLSENLTDGFISPVLWYAVGGLPALILFKVVSTMDSMVGYKTPQYLRFGWCGARLDDLMNLLPARITWLLLALVALVLPGASARKALRIGAQQHALVPGPNSGWSEATMAGAIQRRLIGPIWSRGKLVTTIWLGDPADPEAGEVDDLRRASILTAATGALTAIIAALVFLRYPL